MRKQLLAITTAAAALFALVGCGAGGTTTPTRTAAASTPPAPRTAAAPTPPPRPADPPSRPVRAFAAVRVAGTPYGPALVDHRGFALYRFTSDVSSASTCYGDCAVAWPPYLVGKRPLAAGHGAHTRLLGTVRRRDGRLQVTYAGHPLYYYIDDRRPGEVLCQGVTEFGGTWLVVASDGHAIR